MIADRYVPSKRLDGSGQLDGKVAVITGATAGIGPADTQGFANFGGVRGAEFKEHLVTVISVGRIGRPEEVASGIAMLTAGSRAHYDYAVWPGRRSAQAAPLALTRPKGA